ncbi:MAG: T9SS type A sorting domain-containing protein [Pedobacter sp.]|nr:MAG: T9SS type A sorting domain-containing protein [Pedobacter sp.]
MLTGTVNLSNSVFFGNQAKVATIIAGTGSGKGTLNAVNNTFYQNRFTDAAARGVIAFQNTNFGEANLHNNIFRDNKDASDVLYDLERSVPTNTVILDLKNNLFETIYTGVATKVSVENNYTYSSLLPLFASTTSADANFLHLVEGQATERGNNSLATAAGLLVGIDLFGNNRLLHTNIDLGAYEYQGVLPVQFDYFKATKSGNTASLTWRTISETDNSHFVIERGSSLTNFKELTQKAGAGTTVSATLYSFVDQNPLNGTNYYRLTQYDKNGTSKVLGEQALNFSINGLQNSVYPNPAAQKVFVKLADTKGGVTVDLVSLTGQTILAKAYNISGNEEIAIDLAEVPRGSYILWINKGKNNNDKKKLLVVK